MRKLSRVPLAIVAVGALVLSACGSDDAAADFKACQITDTGGIDDRPSTRPCGNGFLRARERARLEVKYLESTSESDYDPNIQAFIDEGCDVIVTVGFLLGDATEAFAIANPDQAFGIIDYAYETSYDNLIGMVFDTDQAGFLAGYVAAAMTQTGIVGTWGGINIPPVSVFMDGYLAGRELPQRSEGHLVSVLGWDGSDGVFIGSFESQDLGNSATSDMLQNGADIILPVAGPAGGGAGDGHPGLRFGPHDLGRHGRLRLLRRTSVRSS
jgi:basic membrane protein A and related proteins